MSATYHAHPSDLEGNRGTNNPARGGEESFIGTDKKVQEPEKAISRSICPAGSRGTNAEKNPWGPIDAAKNSHASAHLPDETLCHPPQNSYVEPSHHLDFSFALAFFATNHAKMIIG
jgi:hypothetical protein